MSEEGGREGGGPPVGEREGGTCRWACPWVSEEGGREGGGHQWVGEGEGGRWTTSG